MACARCGNEVDVTAWGDGRCYCLPCLCCACPAVNIVNGICRACLRWLHTVMTAEGPRIRDIEVYAICARDEYGVGIIDLIGWSFEEEEAIQSLFEHYVPNPERPDTLAAPPHHRFG